jgi:hypothetical protein
MHATLLVWRRVVFPILVGIALLLLAVSRLEGQTPPPSTAGACFGFSFGQWTPPLDWEAAGHGARPNPNSAQHAPDGRDWAVDLADESTDSSLVLFPAWWPVGVVVRLPRGLLTSGDTLRGRATALIADARRQAPTADVHAWRVPCHKDDAPTPAPRPQP